MRRTSIWVLLAVCGASGAARAYPFMIRQGYTQCSTCHTDPSGGTLLNEYGRAQSELLLSSSYGSGSDSGDSEPTAGRFLGFVPLPSWPRLGGWLQGYLWNAVDGLIVRSATQTDINQDQEYGVAFAISKPTWRADPNGSASQAPRVEDPQFGCSASGRNVGSLWPSLLALGLRLGAALLARRCRRPRA